MCLEKRQTLGTYLICKRGRNRKVVAGDLIASIRHRNASSRDRRTRRKGRGGDDTCRYRKGESIGVAEDPVPNIALSSVVVHLTWYISR